MPDAAAFGLPATPLSAIAVTRHAVDQARDRFDEPTLTHRDIAREVRASIDSGRVATRRPHAFSYDGDRRSGRRKDGSRYAWTADESRCFVLKKTRSDVDGRTRLLVITAYAATVAA